MNRWLEISAFIPKSVTDWPGRVSAVVFVPGRNYSCHYCYSGSLITAPNTAPRIEESAFFESLDQNGWNVEGVTITGGEPTLQGNELIGFCEELQLNGLKVKLDTNGSKPLVLQTLLEEDLVDYVALDLKTALFPKQYRDVTGVQANLSAIWKSVKILKWSGIDYEFRTTFVPSLVSAGDIVELSRQLSRGRRFVLQQFHAVPGIVNKRFETAREPTYDQLLSIAKQIRGFQEVRIRTSKGEEVVSPAPTVQKIKAKKQ